MKATRKRRPCPTCGSPINRGPGQHAYCSDECRPTCVHPTCDKPTRGTTDVCDSHQEQRRRHGELRPDRWAKEWVCVVCGKDVAKGSGRRKHCSANCQQLESQARRRQSGKQAVRRTKGRPSVTLVKVSDGIRPKSARCRLCGEEFSLLVKSGKRIQRADTQWCPRCGRESPEAIRFRRYGITPEDYSTAMGRGCAICGTKVAALHVDHDHSCCPSRKSTTCGECVRGLICGQCNRALGLMRDDPRRLRRAADYLEHGGE